MGQVWPNLPTATAALRTFLSDGPQDRPVKDKIAVGTIDGVNTIFRTFDERLEASTFVASVDFVPQTPAQVVLDDPVLGQFHFTPGNIPQPQSIVRATYYYTYWLDSELQTFLGFASEQLNEQFDISITPAGLGAAALHWAAYFAYDKIATRWAIRASTKFLVEEEPVAEETMNRANQFRATAQNYFKSADKLRESFYNKRHARGFAPAFNVFKPVRTYNNFPIR